MNALFISNAHRRFAGGTLAVDVGLPFPESPYRQGEEGADLPEETEEDGVFLLPRGDIPGKEADLC